MSYFRSNFRPFFFSSFLLYFFASSFFSPFLQQAKAMPRSLQALQIIVDQLTETGVQHGQIPSIYGPKYLDTIDASMSLNPTDPVFIVFFPTGPRIYPQRILVWHEVVNEVIEGTSYIVTYAPITGSLAAYVAKVDGRNLFFDNQGTLYNNNSVLIDRNTGSLWLQLLGMAFAGPLLGRGLVPVPSWWTTWSFAKEAFPDAPILASPQGSNKPYGRDPYGSYHSSDSYYSNPTIMFPLTQGLDGRMQPKTRIFGLEYTDIFMAIDESAVSRLGVINFYIGLTPMMAVYDPRIGVVRVFGRTVWDEESLFRVVNGELTDIETGSIWSFDGKAISGKLSSASLPEYFGITAFWFAWAALHPETFTVPGPNDVPPEALIKKNVQ